jgi:hypothetical protein
MSKNCLIGKYFHSIKKDTGLVEWQGSVLGSPEPGWYLIELFEWVLGESNVMRIVSIEEIIDWLFYEDSESMIFSFEHGIASRRLPEGLNRNESLKVSEEKN